MAARESWYLDVKYASKDSSDLTSLLHEFANCKLESTGIDPEKWLANSDEQDKRRDYELKVHLLGNLPEGCNDVQSNLSGEYSRLLVTEIEEGVADKWKRAFKCSPSSNKITLAMTVDSASKSS